MVARGAFLPAGHRRSRSGHCKCVRRANVRVRDTSSGDQAGAVAGCDPFCLPGVIARLHGPEPARLFAVLHFRQARLDSASLGRMCDLLPFGKPAWLTAIAVMSFVPLFPHCVCYNVGNAWWIDRIGASPLCYGWGFVASVIAVSALRRGPRMWVSVATCGAIVTGATGFFVAHHYFHFPW